jgi:putative tricarboxylic transport membrane protein
MTDNAHQAAEGGPSQRLVEIGVCVLTGLFGLIVIIGSLRVGVNWGVEGPKAGFFPFYIGLFIIGGTLINLVTVLRAGDAGAKFADWSQLRQVMSVVIPTAIYVSVISFLGIYAPSILLIAFFMRWIGSYGWRMVAAVSIGVPIAAYFMFEKWFLVPLPKGPIEDFFNL